MVLIRFGSWIAFDYREILEQFSWIRLEQTWERVGTVLCSEPT